MSVKRYTIGLEGEAASIMDRIPRSMRGMIVGRLLEEAMKLGRLDLILVSPEKADEERPKERKGNRRKRGGEEADASARTRGTEPRGTVVQEITGAGERVHGVVDPDAGSDDGPETVRDEDRNGSEKPVPGGGSEDWIRHLRERIEKKVGF